MGLMDIGSGNPYARINPLAAFINQGLNGYQSEEARFAAKQKDAAAQAQQAQILEFARQDAERKNAAEVTRLQKLAEEAAAKRAYEARTIPQYGFQQGPTEPMQAPMNGLMSAQGSMNPFVDPRLAAMQGPQEAPAPQPVANMGAVPQAPMTQRDMLDFRAQYAGTPTAEAVGQNAVLMAKENPNEFYQKLLASGKYTPESVVDFAAGKGKLQFAKDPTQVTWSEPFVANVGGKKALVQRSSTGQIKPVIEDKSTTVVVSGERNKPGRVLPAAQLETIADMRKVKETLENASNILSSGRVSTGPISGRLQSLGSMVGMTSDKFNDARQQLSTAENIMLKLRSGAAVTEPEFERFKNEYPSVNDSPSVRDRKMANAIKYANDLMDTKLQVFQDGGYKIPESAYSKGGPVPKLKGQSPIGKVGKYSYTVSK